MTIYVLEDDPERIRKFAFWLLGHDWDCAQTCGRVDEFKPNHYDILFLDHDLGGRQMERGSSLSLHEDLIKGSNLSEVIYQRGYGSVEDCGLTFAKLITGKIPENTNIVIHSYNGPGAWKMVQEFRQQGFHAHYYPFGGREFMKIIESIQTQESKNFVGG